MCPTSDPANLPVEIARKKRLHMNTDMYNGPSVTTVVRPAEYSPRVLSRGRVRDAAAPAMGDWPPQQPDSRHSAAQGAELPSARRETADSANPPTLKTHTQTTYVCAGSTYVGKCTGWM